METVDLSQLSASDLEAEIKRRKEAEKKEKAAQKKQFETDKEDFVKHTASKFTYLNKELKQLKDLVITQANELYERMYELNDREPKAAKSFSLKNHADTIRVTVERQERFEFNEEAIVHINAIKDTFKKKFANRNKGFYNILERILIKNSKQEYDPKLLAKARREVRELGDENLISEFDKLDECQKITGSQMYCRVHVKNDKNKWEDVSLQFSSL